LGQNRIHFGPKQKAFCGKTESILRQNGIYFAAKWLAFCGKTENQQHKKWKEMTGNKSFFVSLCLINNLRKLN